MALVRTESWQNGIKQVDQMALVKKHVTKWHLPKQQVDTKLYLPKQQVDRMTFVKKHIDQMAIAKTAS